MKVNLSNILEFLVFIYLFIFLSMWLGVSISASPWLEYWSVELRFYWVFLGSQSANLGTDKETLNFKP